MRTDTILRVDAMNVLIENLGEVDAERFISIVKSDNFDYTKWQRNLKTVKSAPAGHGADPGVILPQ
jgi:hypothetical protein